jgi:hypothetical protein
MVWEELVLPGAFLDARPGARGLALLAGAGAGVCVCFVFCFVWHCGRGGWMVALGPAWENDFFFFFFLVDEEELSGFVPSRGGNFTTFFHTT